MKRLYFWIQKHSDAVLKALYLAPVLALITSRHPFHQALALFSFAVAATYLIGEDQHWNEQIVTAERLQGWEETQYSLPQQPGYVMVATPHKGVWYIDRAFWTGTTFVKPGDTKSGPITHWKPCVASKKEERK